MRIEKDGQRSIEDIKRTCSVLSLSSQERFRIPKEHGILRQLLKLVLKSSKASW